MRHSRSRRQRHSQLPVKIRAPTPNVNAGAERCSIKSSLGICSVFPTRFLPLWSDLRRSQALRLHTQRVKSQSLTLGSKNMGKRKVEIHDWKGDFVDFSSMPESFLPEFSVICIDNDLIWQVEFWITIKDKAIAWQVCDAFCVIGITLVWGDLKLPVLCKMPSERACWKKKKKFYLCGFHILQDWTVGCKFPFTTFSLMAKSQWTLRVQRHRKCSWRKIKPCNWTESEANWWSEPSTSFWSRNKYDTDPNMRLEHTMKFYSAELKFR